MEVQKGVAEWRESEREREKSMIVLCTLSWKPVCSVAIMLVFAMFVTFEMWNFM